eukprot:8146552-Pyramimonas_sp.AAC.1
MTPSDFRPILCVDANASFGKSKYPTRAVGPHVAGVRSWKTDYLHEFMITNELIAANTWSTPATGVATCFYDGRFEPRQIDFAMVCKSFPVASYNAQVRESSA